MHVHVYAINSAVLISSCNSLKSCIFQQLNHHPCKILCQNLTHWIGVINNRLDFELMLYFLIRLFSLEASNNFRCYCQQWTNHKKTGNDQTLLYTVGTLLQTTPMGLSK